MSSCLSVVIPAIINALTSPSGMPPVYDAVAPQSAAMPYVVVQSPTENREGESFGKAAKRFTVEAHVYTSGDDVAGSGQVTDIVNAIAGRMEYPDLDLGASWGLTYIRAAEVIRADTEFDGGATQHYVVIIEGGAEPL